MSVLVPCSRNKLDSKNRTPAVRQEQTARAGGCMAASPAFRHALGPAAQRWQGIDPVLSDTESGLRDQRSAAGKGTPIWHTIQHAAASMTGVPPSS